LIKIKLRKRGDKEIEKLADLWASSWLEEMPAIDFAARRHWFLTHIQSLEKAGAATICAVDGKDRLLGFAVFNASTAYLDQLVVAPEAKGAGIASLLVGEAIKFSCGALYLDVNQDNPRALRFYEKEGFEIIGEGVNPTSGLKTWRLQSLKFK